MKRSSIFLIPDVTGDETLTSPSVSFDIVTDFSPVKSRSVSSSPLSSGSFISEYLSEGSGKLTMEAYAANNPVILSPNNLIDKQTSDGRAKAAYLALNKLYNDKVTCTIVYRFDILQNYFLTKFEPIVMPDDTIGFRLEFEEVRFASEQRVTLVLNMSDEKVKDSNSKTNGGLEKAKPATTKEESEYLTWKIIKESANELVNTGGTVE